MRFLHGPPRHPANQNQEQGADNKCSAPEPILDNAWMAFAANQIYPKLSQRAEINVQEKSRRTANRDPKHVGVKRYPGEPVKVIEETRGKKWMELAEKNNFPTFLLYRRL